MLDPTNSVQMKIWECFDGLLQQTWLYGSALQTLTLDHAVNLSEYIRWFTKLSLILNLLAGVGPAFLCLDDTNGNLTNTQTLQTFQCFSGNDNQHFTTSL